MARRLVSKACEFLHSALVVFIDDPQHALRPVQKAPLSCEFASASGFASLPRRRVFLFSCQRVGRRVTVSRALSCRVISVRRPQPFGPAFAFKTPPDLPAACGPRTAHAPIPVRMPCTDHIPGSVATSRHATYTNRGLTLSPHNSESTNRPSQFMVELASL